MGRALWMLLPALAAAGAALAGGAVFGTNGNDTLVGTPRADALVGLAGDDELYGGAGDDFLSGGPGHDRLFGGDGDDELRDGGGGTRFWDQLRGGAGADVLFGGPGPDVLRGDRGDDRLDGRDPVARQPSAALDPPRTWDFELGGPGDDLVLARDGRHDGVSCGPGHDRAVVDALDVVGGCEVVERR